MFKGIKGGLSHARKDKIKIQFELQLKKLTGLPTDLIDQSITIRWERGSKIKGETSDFKVLKVKKTSSSNEINLNPTSLITRKSSKNQLGGTLEFSTNMTLGGYVIIPSNELIDFKVTLFSDTIHSKQDNSLQINYEEKLLNLYIYNKNNQICSSTLDLSKYTEEIGSNIVQIPFTASNFHPSLQERIAKKDLHNQYQHLNGANKLLEIQGEVYYINPTHSNSSTSSQIDDINTENSISTGTVSWEEDIEDINTSITTTSQQQQIEPEPTLQHQEEPLQKQEELPPPPPQQQQQQQTKIEIQQPPIPPPPPKQQPYQHLPITTTTTTTTVTANLEHQTQQQNQQQMVLFKSELREQKDKNKSLEMENGTHLKTIQEKTREINKLILLLEDSRTKVLEYEEHVHRAQSLENFVKNQLIMERFEFKRLINSKILEEKSRLSDTKYEKELLRLNKEIESLNQTNAQLQKDINNREELIDREKEGKQLILTELKELKSQSEKDKNQIKTLKESLEKNIKENNLNELRKRNVGNGASPDGTTTSTTKPKPVTIKDKILDAFHQEYPSLFHNPVLAWCFAIFCFIMFLIKSLQSC
eukprot:gene6200-7722_t